MLLPQEVDVQVNAEPVTVSASPFVGERIKVVRRKLIIKMNGCMG